MSTIYEEALESAKQHHEVTDMTLEIKALEQAQKQEHLLKLYRELITVKNDMLRCSAIVDDDYYDMEKIETDLEKQIKELENND